MKTKNACLFPALFLTLLSLTLTLSSCEGLFGGIQAQQNVPEISVSGLTVDKYVSGKIGNYDARINLYAKSATFSAEVDVTETAATNARSVQGTQSYDGHYVYNRETKDLFLFFTSSKSYQKAKVDLTGDRGSSSNARAVAQSAFTESSVTEFTSAIATVASLPSESTNPGESDNSGENMNPDDNTNSDDNTNPSDVEIPDPPAGKTYSDYVDGYRTVSLGTQLDDGDVTFVSTIQPLPRPNYSSIDNKVKNLAIDSTKMSIEEAAAYIVQVSRAKTNKEKARAIFTWICYHVDYDHTGYKNTPESAYNDRSSQCDGYSKLFEAMCDAVNIECELWVGLVSSSSANDGKTFNSMSHAWNRVCLDKTNGEYFLVDTTWGSVGTVETGKSMDDFWFDPDPCLFATSHFGDVDGGLINPCLTREQFFSLPKIDNMEKIGFDGKELLEFCYTHKISTPLINLYNTFSKLDELPVFYKIPITCTLKRNTQYEIVYAYKGERKTEQFTTSDSSSDRYCRVPVAGRYIVYNLPLDSAETEPTATFKEPEFKYYDEAVEFSEGLSSSGYYVDCIADGIKFNEKLDGKTTTRAIYDWFYQSWIYISGVYCTDYIYWSYKTDGEPVLSNYMEILRDAFSVLPDSSISLDRKGFYCYCDDYDYNVVYLPLSDKNNGTKKNAVLNYSWESDPEFAEFVRWMENHNVPADQIDFYKEMARYPFQRGDIMRPDNPNELSYWDGKELCEKKHLAGADMLRSDIRFGDTLLDEGEYSKMAGGMQLFFEFRKYEKRHLLNNDTVPILMLHVKQPNATEEPPANFFEEEKDHIKEKLLQGGLTNNFEIDFAEVVLEESYADYMKNRMPDTARYTRPWVNYDINWDYYLSLIDEEKYPGIKEKYKDSNKCAMIKYFADILLNSYEGNINGGYYMHGRLDNILMCMGLARKTHEEIFGSLIKTKSPSCYNMNCVRETAICPLCMYSWDID